MGCGMHLGDLDGILSGSPTYRGLPKSPTSHLLEMQHLHHKRQTLGRADYETGRERLRHVVISTQM